MYSGPTGVLICFFLLAWDKKRPKYITCELVSVWWVTSCIEVPAYCCLCFLSLVTVILFWNGLLGPLGKQAKWLHKSNSICKNDLFPPQVVLPLSRTTVFFESTLSEHWQTHETCCYENCYSEDGTLAPGQMGDAPSAEWKYYISTCSTWEQMTLISFAQIVL